MNGLFDFLEPTEHENNNHEQNQLQIGSKIQKLNSENSDWSEADIILLGCDYDENDNENNKTSGADKIRKALFKMYDWHPSVKVADLGNIRQGAATADTQAALKTVLKEIEEAGKTAILLGGNHNQMLQQYAVFELKKQIIEATVIDRFIDLDDSDDINEHNFLMSLLTRDPNFIRHFSLLGFQSYDVNPNIMETLDKLRFDCVRLGQLREHIQEYEPTIRHAQIMSIDLQVLRASEAEFLKNASPNGLFGDEICQLAKYAGMSSKLASIGIFGYQHKLDFNEKGAELIAQMIWYFVDGYRIRKQEVSLENLDNFISYYVAISGTETLFIKSKYTGRWWLQLPDFSFIPCTYNDYLTAGRDDIPERWLRAQERIS